MNIEKEVNHWLTHLSSGQWQLDDGVCNLTDNKGKHYCTFMLTQSRLVLMFMLHQADRPNNPELHSDLLLLNNHSDMIGFASFSLASDDRTVVLSTSLPVEAIETNTLNNFWSQSNEARNIMFSVLTTED